MRKIHGIGWDDSYYTDSDNYFNRLKTILKDDYEIQFTINDKIVGFQKLYKEPFKSWEFAILDMVDDSGKVSNQNAGYDLASWIRGNNADMPIFIVTRSVEEVVKKGIIPAQPFFYFSRSLDPENVAFYISEVLSYHGILAKKVFIGHGGSDEWTKLSSYINGKGIEVSEFNEDVAKDNSIKERLNTMKKESAVAILVFTGADQLLDGTFIPRRNVLHETGFFQGYFGFEKVQILLEDGCEFFSNNQGIIYEKFPKGKIENVFPAVKAFLSRHGFNN